VLAEWMIKASLSDNTAASQAAVARFLAVLSQKTQTREIAGQELDDLRSKLQPVLTPMLAGGANGEVTAGVASLLASMGDRDAVVLTAVRRTLNSTNKSDSQRLEALGPLLMLGDIGVLDEVGAILADPAKNSVSFRAAVLAALGRSDDPRVAPLVLNEYSRLEPELQPRAIELLTQRSIWAKDLLGAIGRHEISADALNVNQVQRLLGSRDKELAALVEAKWGTVRTDRNPQREKVVQEMKTLISSRRGDPMKGWVAFKKVCAQCHKIYGEGQDVGPEITANGRASFDQLLSNVFDPSLVIGAGYQARIVTTTDGRVLTGLLAENNAQRVVLKMQGGKTETIPRSNVESLAISKLSLMPEGVEKQYTRQELIDLFEFLMLDKPPTDPTAKHIPGTPR
jgi:putative heme-binding domain-containing protein